MATLVAVVCVLAVGTAWLRGGSPVEFANVRLRYLPVPVVAVVAQALSFSVLGGRFPALSEWFVLGSSALLLLFLLANLAFRSLAIVAVGTALNLAVVGANGGYMPVRIADVQRAGLADVASHLASDGHYQKSAATNERTRLSALGDVILTPVPGGWRLISIGDVCVAAGIFLFIQEALIPRRQKVIGPAPTVA